MFMVEGFEGFLCFLEFGFQVLDVCDIFSYFLEDGELEAVDYFFYARDAFVEVGHFCIEGVFQVDDFFNFVFKGREFFDDCLFCYLADCV